MDIRKFLVGGSAPSYLPADIGWTITRVVVGLSMALQHGLGKVPPSDRFIGGVANLGFPAPEFFAWAAGLSELVGGLLLAAGLLTRPAALMLAATMAVACFGRHGADPFSDKEMSLLYLVISGAFVLAGSGRFSVDRLIHARD
jgi:putative oxidoreductase